MSRNGERLRLVMALAATFTLAMSGMQERLSLQHVSLAAVSQNRLATNALSPTRLEANAAASALHPRCHEQPPRQGRAAPRR